MEQPVLLPLPTLPVCFHPEAAALLDLQPSSSLLQLCGIHWTT